MIDGAPQPMPLAPDRDDNLVQMPFVATHRGPAANAPGIVPAEFLRPVANSFVAHLNASDGEHLLNHPKAQREPEIKPDRIADNLGGKTVATIKRITRWCHDRFIDANSSKIR